VPISYVLGPWNDPKGHGGRNQHVHLETTHSHECVVVGEWILRQHPLARVSEHPAFGGVCRNCHRGKAHYAPQHRAIDVNLGYGSPPAERPFLEHLRKRLTVGLDVDTLRVKDPVPSKENWMANEAKKIDDLHKGLDQIRMIANYLPMLQKDIAERQARVVRYLKAFEENDKARAAAILKELDELEAPQLG